MRARRSKWIVWLKLQMGRDLSFSYMVLQATGSTSVPPETGVPYPPCVQDRTDLYDQPDEQ